MVNISKSSTSRYVIYDFETTGRNSHWDQIIQVGAILVDDKLTELDRLELRSSLKPGLIPEPGALLVNNTSPEMLIKSNLSHYSMIKELSKKFIEWSPAIFMGYNSIDFDEEFLRKTLFKSLYNPYLTQQNGNKRCDVLNMVRSASIHSPNVIKHEKNNKGNPVLKLDQIAPLNNIIHQAHDALGDVLATNQIAKILSLKAKDIWNSALITSTRSEVNAKVKSELLFCCDEFIFGKTKPFLFSFVCEHPVFKWSQCFDLSKDPKEYFNMSKNELSIEIKKSPKVIRTIKDNKNPIIMDYNNYIKNSEFFKYSEDEYVKRAKNIQENDTFKSMVSSILQEDFEKNNIFDSQEEILAEESLYKGGFFSNTDKQLMEEFHISEWLEKLKICDKFNDERLFYFGMRLIYEEQPSVLPKDIFNKIHISIANQVLSMNNEKWYTIPKAYKDSDDLKAKFENENDFEKLIQLKKFDLLIDQIQSNFE